MLSPQHPREHVRDCGQTHLAQLQEAWTPSLRVRPEWGDPIQLDREGKGEVPIGRLPSLLFGAPRTGLGDPMDKPTWKWPLHRTGSVKVKWMAPLPSEASRARWSRTRAWVDFMLPQKFSVP